MKLSLAWIFDHLEDSWHNHSVDDLVNKFNTHCAEIEGVTHYSLDLTSFALAEVITRTPSLCTLFVPEWNTNIELPVRPDGHLGARFMVTRSNNAYAWTRLKDLGHAREGLLDALFVNQKDFEGTWKNWFETEDYIIEIENKSITHRSDLWCHRGIAREFSLLCNTTVSDLKKKTKPLAIHEFDNFSSGTPHFPWMIKRETLACHRFATATLSNLPSNNSTLWMASRLLRVDARPTNLVVDTTNYVMFDLGQPLHAFDGATLNGKTLTTRTAHENEKLTLLDGKEITLKNSDIVVADQTKAVALAGIMGGAESATTLDTQEFIIEAATYEGPTIRKTATRLKLRTESSARFEKTLDPDNTLIGIARLLHLIENAPNHPESSVKINTAPHEVHVLGKPATKRSLSVSHAFIEERLGIPLEPSWVHQTLEKLDFGVTNTMKEGTTLYTIEVPTLRSIKDITTAQDIVEEVGRCWGYSSIPLSLAPLTLKGHSLKNILTLRTIKNYFATAGALRQISTYALFDETFLAHLDFDPGQTLALMNPISQNYRRLLTTLVPNLLKGIAENREQTEVRFFEINKVWPTKDPHNEITHLAGLIYSRHHAVDFYQTKHLILGLFKLLDLTIEFVKHTPSVNTPWYAPYQTAALMCCGQQVGVAGKANPLFLEKIESGDAYIFELNLDLLISLQPNKKVYTPLPKYPGTYVDLSLMVPASLQAIAIEAKLAQAHPSIVGIDLIDMFQKKEWTNQRSLTFRIHAQDRDRTLTKEDIDEIYKAASACGLSMGGTIR